MRDLHIQLRVPCMLVYFAFIIFIHIWLWCLTGASRTTKFKPTFSTNDQRSFYIGLSLSLTASRLWQSLPKIPSGNRSHICSKSIAAPTKCLGLILWYVIINFVQRFFTIELAANDLLRTGSCFTLIWIRDTMHDTVERPLYAKVLPREGGVHGT